MLFTVNFQFRIVRSFEAIARGLLQQENFTNITVIRRDIAFIGELVSIEQVSVIMVFAYH